MRENSLPYKNCKTCKTLGDCHNLVIAEDMMGSPLPPDVCLKPIEIMTNTLKARKMKFDNYLSNKKENDIF